MNQREKNLVKIFEYAANNSGIDSLKDISLTDKNDNEDNAYNLFIKCGLSDEMMNNIVLEFRKLIKKDE